MVMNNLTNFVPLGYIDHFWKNLLKVGREKVTRAYLTARLELLKSYWSKFFENHDELLVMEKVETTDYMCVKQDVFTKTEEHYIVRSGPIIKS